MTNSVISVAGIGKFGALCIILFSFLHHILEKKKGKMNEIVKYQILHRETRKIAFSIYLYFVSLHEQTARFRDKDKCNIATAQEKIAMTLWS